MHGLLITRVGLQPFVVTLCGLLIYRGVARFYTDDATAGFAFGQNFPTLECLTAGRICGVAAQPRSPFCSSSPSIMWVVLHRSVFGRYLFAVGKNEEAARYSGIRTGRVIIAAYVICCGLTALAAIFFAMYTRSISPASHGNFYELYAIAAAVLGGFSLRGGEGSIIGVVLGTVLLQVLQNLVNLLGIPSSLNFAVMGSVILIGVLADQQFSALPTTLDRACAASARRARGRPRAHLSTSHQPSSQRMGLASIPLILVTGATGKVGRAFIDAPARRSALRRCGPRALPQPRAAARTPRRGRARLDRGPRRRAARVAGVTHVLHLATCKETPEDVMDVTVKGLFWLLEGCRDEPAFQQFILIGGDAGDRPFRLPASRCR